MDNYSVNLYFVFSLNRKDKGHGPSQAKTEEGELGKVEKGSWSRGKRVRWRGDVGW